MSLLRNYFLYVIVIIVYTYSMDKKIVTAIFIILCLIVPMLWFSINYAALSAQGNKNAVAGHTRLVRLVQNLIAAQNYQYQKYQLDMFIKQEPEISGFSVYKPGENPLLIYPSSASLEQLQNTIKPFNTMVFSEDLPQGYKLLTIATLIPPEHIRTLGFESLGLFLISFFLFIFIIIVLPIKNRNHSLSTNAINSSLDITINDFPSIQNNDDKSSYSQEFSQQQHETQHQNQTQEQSQVQLTSKINTTLQNTETDTNIITNTNTDNDYVQKNVNDPPLQHIRTTLFDPQTGLCWAEDLIPRLEEEIKRAASFENELVFIIANLDMNLYEPEDYKIFCDTVRNFFSFRDMVFQYKNDSIGIILQNMDIDHALRMCEELIKKITYLIQQNKNEMHYVEAFFGMSTRGGRILDSSRLIHEAEVALEKAKEEHDTHVVAFKPDLEKYKQYIIATRQ